MKKGLRFFKIKKNLWPVMSLVLVGLLALQSELAFC